MTESPDPRSGLLEFLASVAKPGRRLDGIDDGTDLVRSGVLDSLALIQVIAYLEQEYDLDLLELGIDPMELSTIGGMTAAIARATIARG